MFKLLDKLKKYKQKVYIIFLCIIGLAIAIGYTNCSGVNLQALKSLPIIATDISKSTFPFPLSQSEETRIAFFVDMSVSMAHGLCPCDLAADQQDNPQLCPGGFNGFNPLAEDDPGQTAVNTCDKIGVDVSQGVDPLMSRLKVMRNWLLEIQDNPDIADDVRVIVVPFNGGRIELQRNDNLEFVSVDEAIDIVDQLMQEQMDSVDFYFNLALNFNNDQASFEESAIEASKMATTVASTRLETLKEKIQTEAQDLGNNSANAVFEVVILSDGVPKPRVKHFKEAIYRMWDQVGFAERGNAGGCDNSNEPENGCIDSCGDELERYLLGDLSEFEIQNCGHGFVYFASTGACISSQRQCFNSPLRRIATFQDQDNFTVVGFNQTALQILEDMERFWGEPFPNSPNRIALKIADIKSVIEETSSVNSRINLVWVNPTRISPEMTSDTENFIVRAKINKVHNRFKVLTSDTPPFSLISVGDELEAFDIGALFVLNPFTRLDSNGNLKADSDADGLFDDQENITSNGVLLSVNNPRSNGVCLDILTKKGLCNPGSICKERVDIDGDGLNECEELILGTSDRDFDSDSDSLPDGPEVVYGFDPKNTNDLTSDSNLDGNRNFVNFKVGAHPQTKINFVPPANKISLFVNKNEAVYEDGRPKRYMYEVLLNNLPLLPTSNSSGFPLYYTPNQIATNLVPVALTGMQHSSTVPIIILAKIVNTLHNGDVHWAYDVITFNQSVQNSIDIDLENLKYFKVIDPQAGDF